MNDGFLLPQIPISSNLYTILKIIFMVSAFIVVAFNVLNASALPANTTDWDWGNCNCELVDDDKEEDSEEQDEKLHEEESREQK
jgi:hypothetical protein